MNPILMSSTKVSILSISKLLLFLSRRECGYF
nr:MAG TPA: hypothetical protein [Caudoviricetes sp.]